MNAARALAIAALMTGACRPGDPEDPKTPPNSPIPDIDRPKDAVPSLGDAGAGAVQRGAAPNATLR